ncbi:MAG TPA: TrkA family potassium uptake protein [Candidatus Limnocylindrales bacterium]|jgi:trk system potassium uptake protein TrkA
MKIVIVGCGRVGSTLAENLDADGHEVIIFDIKTSAFDRLPETFKGTAVRGDGTDVDVLRRSGAEGADIFLALTEGDNRNVMSAQVATESLGVAQVIAKINDPVRAAAYAELGIATLCRTNLMVDSVAGYLNLPMKTGPGIEAPEAPGHEHPHPSAEGIDTPAIAGPTANRRAVISSAADAARASRLGFRRPRG